MINLRNDFESPDGETERLTEATSVPCPAEDVKLWEEAFSVLKPPPPEPDGWKG